MSGVVVLVVGILVYVYFKDDPVPDDSDVLPVFTPERGPNNPLSVFCREMEGYDFSSYHALPIEARLKPMEHAVAVREFLSGQATLVASFDRLMQSNGQDWGVPEMLRGGDRPRRERGFNSRASTAIGIVRMKCELLIRDKRNKEAAELSLKLMMFARSLSQAEGGLLDQTFAVGMAGVHLNTFRSCILPEFDESFLQTAQAAIAACELEPKDMAFAVQVEYQSAKKFIEDFLAGRFQLNDVPLLDNELSEWLLRPNRTLGNYVDADRAFMHGLSNSWLDGVRSFRKVATGLN